jgi:hypothetical protein
MQKIKKHAVWVILVAIIIGLVLMFKSRKVAAEPVLDAVIVQASELSPASGERDPMLR